MAAALRLLQSGFEVTLYEASTRLGGKAGAVKIGDRMHDHGYHIFPAWYLNIWDLVSELGLTDNFGDLNEWSFLRAGDYPNFKKMGEIASLPGLIRNIFSGFASPADAFLFLYSALDLATQPLRKRAELDQVTLKGFLDSRFYMTEPAAEIFQDSALKAISIPAYHVSAMAVRTVTRHWINYPEPIVRIALGNLQQTFIEPIEKRLLEMGCHIHRGCTLQRLIVNDGNVEGLEVQSETGVTRINCQTLVIALPVYDAAGLVDDNLYTADPTLGNLHELRSRPMVALDVQLNINLRGLPLGHVTLLDSKFDLTFIDVSRWWPNRENTCINLIASNYETLHTLSDSTAEKMLIDELARFIPEIRPSSIVSITLQRHHAEPLFITDVGAWHFRPNVRTAISNVYLAGDYVRSPVDITCMEGAVTTGFQAAEAIAKDYGCSVARPVRRPRADIPMRFRILKHALLPVAGICKLISWLQKRTAG